MEDFSQSRGDDDLFDDEIVPFEEDTPTDNITAHFQQVSLEPEPVLAPSSEPIPASAPAPAPVPASVPVLDPTPAPITPTPTTSKDSPLPGFKAKPRGRGGLATGRGGIPRKAGGLEDSKWAPKPTKQTSSEDPPKDSPLEPLPKQAQPSTEPEKSSEQQSQPEDGTSSPNIANAPSGPANVATTQRPPAVRGDRTATGGVRKPKLTDEELTAKLAAAKERSQNIAAAHARAQADAASFEERERIASAKRERDRVERKAMDSEREKNRQRKMAVMGGREWDADKNEDDFRITQNGRGGGRRMYAGGLSPAEQYQAEQDDLKMYEWHDDRGRGRGRGRGGRGGGRGRGGRGSGPRGGAFGAEPEYAGAHQRQPDLTTDSDFPALPGTAKKDADSRATTTTISRPDPKRWDSGGLPSSGDGGGSWAEQVESVEQAENTSKP